MTNVPSAHESKSVPVTRPSMIMDRIIPKSFTMLAASRILGVRVSRIVLTISNPVRSTEIILTPIFMPSHLLSKLVLGL